MVKKYLLDTNILIDLYQGSPKVKRVINLIKLEECDICSAVTAEFFQGLYRKKNVEKERRWYDDLVEGGRMNVIPFDEVVAMRYAEIQMSGLRKGKPRPFFDLVIAATALTDGLTLVTSNIRDFEMIEGLKFF